MVSLRSQITLLIAVFIFVLIHNLLRIYAQTLDASTLFYQTLMYTQYALYGSLFLVGSTYFLKKRIAHKLRFSPPKKRAYYTKHYSIVRIIHALTYGYPLMVLFFFVWFQDADKERPYHFILYFISTVSVSIWFSKIEPNETFAMDR
jgi:hypothetical protein